MATRFRFRRAARIRGYRIAAPLIAMFTFAFSTEAHSQVVPGGFPGGYGWGGWGGETVAGSGFRGMGAFAQGLGAGDLQSAQADAVRTQSFMELNEYLYQSARLHRLQAAAARQASQERVAEAREELRDRRTNDPSPREIESGDAINTILYDLDNPAIPDSVVRDAADGMTIPGKTIQKIPFMFTHRGTAVSLQRLTSDEAGWPAALRNDSMSPLRDRYEAIIEEILEIPEGESVPTELLTEARNVLGEMYRTIQQAGLEGPTAAEALRHLKAQAAMTSMLQQPDVKKVIDEAANVEEVTLPTLMNFMRFYNLQFGAAQTPEEQALYRQELYPKFAQVHQSLRDQFNGELPGAASSETERRPGNPTGAFEGLDWEALGIPSQEQPAPSDREAPEASLNSPERN